APAPASQGGKNLLLSGKLGRQPHRHEKYVDRGDVGHRIVDLDRQAIGRDHRLTIGGNGGPAIIVVAKQPVGRAKGVYRRRQRKHGKLVNQQEGELPATLNRISHGRPFYWNRWFRQVRSPVLVRRRVAPAPRLGRRM